MYLVSYTAVPTIHIMVLQAKILSSDKEQNFSKINLYERREI